MKFLSINIRSVTLSVTLLGSAALYANPAQAETIEGRFNGLGCAAVEDVCPIDSLDSHIALEGDFILQTTGGKYYFITNLDRAIKARHLLRTVRVIGKLSAKINAISASELWVKDKGEFKLIWSTSMQDEQRKIMSGTQ